MIWAIAIMISGHLILHVNYIGFIVIFSGGEVVDFDDTTVFSAGLNYHATFYDHNVMYNHIFFANVSNTNVGYNPHTGEYVVPQTEIYLFHYHGISLQGKVRTEIDCQRFNTILTNFCRIDS